LFGDNFACSQVAHESRAGIAFVGNRQLTTGLTVRVYESLKDLETLRPAWEKLLEQIPTASIFNTWEWLSCWWRAFANEQELWVLAIHDPFDHLIGLAPLSFAKVRVAPGLSLRVCRLMGDGSTDSDNLDLLAQPGYEQDVVSCVLAELKNLRSRWDFCSFNTIPGNSEAGSKLLKQLRKCGWTVVREEHPWSLIELADDWPSYLAILSKKEVDKLSYYRRRIEKRYQARFFQCVDSNLLDNYLADLFQLHQQRWQASGEPGSFQSPARRAFYSEMAHEFLSRKWLQFWLLELNGSVAAAQFTFRYRNIVYALQEGFDPSYASDSIGFVLRGVALQKLIEDGVKRYDFLMGEDRSKARWGAKKQFYQNVCFAMPFSFGSLWLQIHASAKATKEYLRNHISPRSWNALKWVGKHLLGLRKRKLALSSATPSK
jgi:CelD/BcsL family acetyltransferase involved in cellulose biosynthesis